MLVKKSRLMKIQFMPIRSSQKKQVQELLELLLNIVLRIIVKN